MWSHLSGGERTGWMDGSAWEHSFPTLTHLFAKLDLMSLLKTWGHLSQSAAGGPWTNCSIMDNPFHPLQDLLWRQRGSFHHETVQQLTVWQLNTLLLYLHVYGVFIDHCHCRTVVLKFCLFAHPSTFFVCLIWTSWNILRLFSPLYTV